MKFIEEMRHAH